MGKTRIDAYQIEPGASGTIVGTFAGVASWVDPDALNIVVVDTTSAVDGNVPVWNAAASGWVASGAASTGGGLTDTAVASAYVSLAAAASAYLTFTAGASAFVNITGDAMTGTLTVTNGASLTSLTGQRIDLRAASADTFAAARLSTTGFTFGPGGGSPQDVSFARSSADIMAMGAGDKIQQNQLPSVGDDLTNMTFVVGAIAASALPPAAAASAYLSLTAAASAYMPISASAGFSGSAHVHDDRYPQFAALASAHPSFAAAASAYLSLTNAASAYLRLTSAASALLTLDSAASAYPRFTALASAHPTFAAMASAHLTFAQAASAYVDTAGDTMVGSLTMASGAGIGLGTTQITASAITIPNSPTASGHAINQQYLFQTIAASAGGGGMSQASADAMYVNVTGDVMTGNLIVSPTGTADLSASGTTAGRINLGVRGDANARMIIYGGNASGGTQAITFTDGQPAGHDIRMVRPVTGYLHIYTQASAAPLNYPGGSGLVRITTPLLDVLGSASVRDYMYHPLAPAGSGVVTNRLYVDTASAATLALASAAGDARYVNVTGDTMTGTLFMDAASEPKVSWRSATASAVTYETRAYNGMWDLQSSEDHGLDIFGFPNIELMGHISVDARNNGNIVIGSSNGTIYLSGETFTPYGINVDTPVASGRATNKIYVDTAISASAISPAAAASAYPTFAAMASAAATASAAANARFVDVAGDVMTGFLYIQDGSGAATFTPTVGAFSDSYGGYASVSSDRGLTGASKPGLYLGVNGYPEWSLSMGAASAGTADVASGGIRFLAASGNVRLTGASGLVELTGASASIYLRGQKVRPVYVGSAQPADTDTIWFDTTSSPVVSTVTPREGMGLAYIGGQWVPEYFATTQNLDMLRADLDQHNHDDRYLAGRRVRNGYATYIADVNTVTPGVWYDIATITVEGRGIPMDIIGQLAQRVYHSTGGQYVDLRIWNSTDSAWLPGGTASMMCTAVTTGYYVGPLRAKVDAFLGTKTFKFQITTAAGVATAQVNGLTGYMEAVWSQLS